MKKKLIALASMALIAGTGITYAFSNSSSDRSCCEANASCCTEQVCSTDCTCDDTCEMDACACGCACCE